MKISAILKIVLFSSFLITVAPVMARADGDVENCPLYKAVYAPHPSYYEKDGKKIDRDLDYVLTIHEPPEGMRRSDIRYDDYYIHTFRFKTTQELSRYRMGAGCAGGSATICTIGGLSYIGLNKDFSSSSGDHAAYALVIPTLGLRMHGVNWDKNSGIEFLTAEKIPPSTNVPSVWILNNCQQ